MNDQPTHKALECCLKLAALNVVRMEVRYSGSGDEGAIDQILAFSALGQPIELPGEIGKRIEDWIYELIPPDFEIDSGSHGTLTLDVANRHIRIDHDNIVRTTENEVLEYDLNEQDVCADYALAGQEADVPTKDQPIRVCIVVEGAHIQDVFADGPVKYLVKDFDEIESGVPFERQFYDANVFHDQAAFDAAVHADTAPPA
jgi:hypothetical protein